MDQAAAVAKHLLDIRAVKLSPHDPFTWASGILSPIYCDNRVALSYPAARNFLRDAMLQQSGIFGPVNVVAGVATAGIPLGAILADHLGLPFVYVRSGAKDHGRKNMIEGELPEQARVLLVEDLISTGGSSIKAVTALQEAGATVKGVLAVFQYGFQEAADAFSAINIPIATLTSYDILIRQASLEGYITSNDLDTLQQWRANPKGWGPLYAV